MLMMALFWVGAIWLVVWGVRQLAPTPNQGGGPDALETLKRRYARGEISYDEFEQAREALRPRGYTGQTMRLEDEVEQAREVRR
ncbi:MAG TPA: SHOCT domain-containing protein [Roseiflexaceae bacterium]|nr:SHOCT domain-containing protein [Roseiflexaceae bacterium]